MEELIAPAIVIIGLLIALFKAVNWHNNPRKIALQTLDLALVPSYLKRRKNIVSHYRGHHIRFDTGNVPTRHNKNNDNNSLPSIVNEPFVSTRLIIDANGFPKDNQPLRNFSKENIAEQITRLLIPNDLQYKLKGEMFVVTNGCRVIYTQRGIETDINYLQFLLDMLIDLIEAYPLVVTLGGEAIQPLIAIGLDKSHVLSPVAPQLLRDIELETAARMSSNPSRFLCKRCWVRCTARKVPVSKLHYVRYYGCRACGQSRDVIEWKEWVVAVLDSDMAAKQRLQDSVIQVNWLVQRAPFDFDEVQIMQATDEDVERFAVQIGNDTDRLRKPKYEQMRCIISSGCELSPNTSRILQSIFGQVEVTYS